MHKSIIYHTRGALTGEKIMGGSFGGAFDMDTVNRLIRYHKYKVLVKPSGTPVFVDVAGREVHMYFSVDPRFTDAGKEALDADKQKRFSAQAIEEEKERLVNDLIANMTTEELLERLS